MRCVPLVLLMLFAGAAAANSGTCTFTYNPLTKSIIRNCDSRIPIAGPDLREQIALKKGQVRSCVISGERDPRSKQIKLTRECK